MSDIKRYVQKRTEIDAEFAENYEAGYENFKIGVILRQARDAAGLTQEEVARRLNTKKSAISRIENHADDVRLSTLQRYANAVGADLLIRLTRSVTGSHEERTRHGKGEKFFAMPNRVSEAKTEAYGQDTHRETDREGGKTPGDKE